MRPTSGPGPSLPPVAPKLYNQQISRAVVPLSIGRVGCMEIIFTIALLASLLHTALILRVEAAVAPVQGVNLGGWFVLEPWYV